ncbi:hypothetical protein GUITHDRAFT_155346 [Guillardia theta CCMP2712]|uniref:trimethyllysine dioxygenase n=1 Tax=Guillardia theta (strain CCMP2712) TaxID=905079 RepID=L1IIJ4_GUITC|nr:hypothetical protein GUITHDRAFT_155346 [Guillardia theta CCMP2712]EKX36051.1 hypothetical protein GUITHDRAFT_155346 [Guillardia theta CCMP2712]|mmetsp:Transcript_7298/g.25102  ORF Transcript_7298/g.25102 Transcript_7298/m.25102 type:complete len:495 (-) Transcript_7298:378-1862(-)|eukprot:XP_005823031.1 hypothetical protein GUITHDRAFT_155346 [Guillardia theta CCMP2712]
MFRQAITRNIRDFSSRIRYPTVNSVSRIAVSKYEQATRSQKHSSALAAVDVYKNITRGVGRQERIKAEYPPLDFSLTDYRGFPLPSVENRMSYDTDAFVIWNMTTDIAERALEVVWKDGHHSKYHFIWLRDHEYSHGTAASITNQRTVDTAKIPLDIAAESIEVTDNGRKVKITWNRHVDGVKVSEFDTKWLRHNCYSHHNEIKRQLRNRPWLWGNDLNKYISNVSVPFEEVMRDDKAVLELLRKVKKFGLAIVSNTPTCKETSQKVVERIGPVRNTIYGGFWETRLLPADDKKNIDSAFSTCALPAHTDGNYWQDPPGIQVFHCLEPDLHGGDTLLVDGFKVAEDLKEIDSDSFNFLCETPVPFQHTDKENHLVSYHTVFGKDADGNVIRFSLNTLDRDVMRLPPSQVLRFYKAWQQLCSIVADPSNEAWLKLMPGQLIIIDNKRVMHGRSEISPRSGRVLVGCYLSHEDFASKLAVLEKKCSKGTSQEDRTA